MSALGKQFDWHTEHNPDTGVTYHVHKPTGFKVWNTLHSRHKWEIKGGPYHAEVFQTLSEAKRRIESHE